MSKIKKALVTGAAGFVGSAVCRELALRGAEVIALVRREASALSKIDGVRTVICDMADYGRLGELINDRDIDAFFHFAWQGGAGAERADKDIQLANVAGACDVVAGCAALECRRFIYAASLGENEVTAFMHGEESPPASMIYHTAKLAANYMARATAARLDIDYLQGKISNIYGPGEESDRLISASLRKLARGERCSFTAGDQPYDFIYITDAARAFAEIAESGTPNRCYYIGNPSTRPLKDFLTAMGNAAGKPELIGLGYIPYVGTPFNYSSIDMGVLTRDTGFMPEVGFADGIQNTWEWTLERAREAVAGGI